MSYHWGACIPHDSSEVVICSELENGEELFLSTKKLTPGLLVGVWSLNQREKQYDFIFPLWNTLLRRHQVGGSTRKSNWQIGWILASKSHWATVITQNWGIEGVFKNKTRHTWKKGPRLKFSRGFNVSLHSEITWHNVFTKCRFIDLSWKKEKKIFLHVQFYR